MRQIVLDTETTGLEPEQGHRVIEIGCVELVDRQRTGQTFHVYLNPERAVEEGAEEVHGLSDAFLADKPRFAEVAGELIEFIRGAELIIHNAPFDVGFLDHELTRMGADAGPLEDLCTITDSLTLARAKRPGRKNSLDALCKDLGVDNSQRDLHGALLDAQLLADVYLTLTGGQTRLMLDEADEQEAGRVNPIRRLPSDRPRLPVIAATPEEIEAHRQSLERIAQACGGASVWQSLEEAGPGSGAPGGA